MWNDIWSESELSPHGLFDPDSGRNNRCTMTRAAIMKGKIKQKAKNHVRVALSNEKPPQIHLTRVVPM